MILAKTAYGFLFVAVLPALLVLWSQAAEPNIRIAAFGSRELGIAIAAVGLLLMIMSMRELWLYGRGLPMNAFPPETLVARGSYRWIPHPIYTGFVTACAGLSMAAESRAGLWLISPVMAAACVALVYGYERPDLIRRFGSALRLLPPDTAEPPTLTQRLRFFPVVVFPWLILYAFTINLHLPGSAFRFPFEDRLPILTWTTVIYQSSFLTVAIAPWCAATQRDLRRLMITAWTAMAVVYPTYWVMPSTAPRRPLVVDSLLAQSLHAERTTYPPTAAFPSFHVLWAIFVARLYRPRWIGIAYAAAVTVSCITTAMHYIPDALASLALAPVFLDPGKAWRTLLRGTERLANSWRQWRIGPVRIINHALYAGAAAFAQTWIVSAAVGPELNHVVILTAVAGIVGAALWAQWVEGSPALLRPFGFYGGLIAIAAVCLLFQERWLLLAAQCLAAPWMQAIGRLRCLVNGCCHGAACSAACGIRVTQDHSRVTRLAQLTGTPIYPTQLYSILINLFLGLLLMRLWRFNAPLTIIIGVYAIGNGLGRFVEEAYRGEPQTPKHFGLRLYQWLALASVIIGAGITAVPSGTPPELHFTSAGFLIAIVAAPLAAIAMGVDFPASRRRFARLT